MAFELKINHDSHVPLFFQIQKQIRRQIENKKLTPGSQLPTERELSARLGVTRVTVRKAMRGLVAEGYCENRVGRGIFVASPKLIANINYLEGTSEFLTDMGLSLTTVVIKHSVMRPFAPLQEYLGITEADDVLYLKRLRLIDDEPVMLEKTFLPLQKYPGLEHEDLRQSLYALMRKKYGVEPHHAQGTFDILVAGDDESELLHTNINIPLLVKEGVVYTKEQHVVEYNLTYFRSNKFKFTWNSMHTRPF